MSQRGLAMLCDVNKFDAQGTTLDSCNECHYGKHSKCSFYFGVSCKLCALDLVYMNMWSLPTMSMGGANYYVSFIDDHLRKTWVY